MSTVVLMTTAVGERIARLRELTGLSQRDMSELAGLTEQHVRLLEIGERRSPSVETIVRLAHAYDTSLEWLATGDGDEPDPARVHVATAARRAERDARKAG